MPRPTNSKNTKRREGSRQLFKRRKFCRFTVEGIAWVDYKDAELLKDFVAENGSWYR